MREELSIQLLIGCENAGSEQNKEFFQFAVCPLNDLRAVCCCYVHHLHPVQTIPSFAKPTTFCRCHPKGAIGVRTYGQPQ